MPSHIDAKTLQEILQGNASLDSVNSTTPAQQNFNPIPDIASAYGGFRNTGEGGFRNTGEGGFRTVPIAPPTPPAVSDIKAQELIQNVINKSKQVGMKLSEKEQNLLSAHTALQEFDQAIAARKENQQTAIFSDDEVDTFTGKAGNLFVRLAAKTGDVFRTPLNATARLRRGALEKGITPEQQALYQSGLEKFERRAGYDATLARLIEQPESPERNTRIADIRAKLREQILTPEEAYIFSKESARSNPEDIYQTESIGSRLDQAKQLGEFIDAGEQVSQRAASRINTKFSDKANRRLTNTSKVTAKHLEQGEYLEGIGSFLKGVKDLATEDTYAASEMLVGMVPHMIAMMYAAPVFLPSLASELNDQAIEEYKKVNNELPTDEERALIGLLSVANASLDKLGAAATQNAAKITKSILASSTTLNKKLPQTVLKGLTATGAPIGGALPEGATEGGQNVLEQVAKTIRDPKVDPSKALVDATYGVLGGVAFASPGVASQVAEASADVAQRGLDVVQRGVEAVGSTVEQALVKNTDKFIDKTKEANTPVDTQAGIERILNDGFKGLDDNATKQRIVDIIGLNQKLKEFKADNPDLDVKNYDDTITTLITQFKNKELNTAVETVATNPESINEVAKAISQGADLPLKTLETVSGSTLFKDASPETKKIIEEAIQVKKSLEETARDIQDGSEDGKFKGISQYLRDINQVNIIKDAALADQTVTALTNWEQAQQNKLDAYLNAREESARTGNNRVEFELDGAVKYYQKGRTEKLIGTIESELGVIRNTLDKAVAARNNIAETVSEAPVAPVAEIVPDTSPIQTTPPQRAAEATKAAKPRVAEDVSGRDTDKPIQSENEVITDFDKLPPDVDPTTYTEDQLESLLSSFERDDIGDSRTDEEWALITPFIDEDSKRRYEIDSQALSKEEVEQDRLKLLRYNAELYSGIKDQIARFKDFIARNSDKLAKTFNPTAREEITQKINKDRETLLRHESELQELINELPSNITEADIVKEVNKRSKQLSELRSKDDVVERKTKSDRVLEENYANASKLTNAQLLNSVKIRQKKIDSGEFSGKVLSNIRAEIGLFERILRERLDKENIPVEEQFDTETKISTYTLHSGGAKGADSSWEKIGAKYGLVNSRHYFVEGNKTPEGNTSITKEEASKADPLLKKANVTLKRKYPTKNEYVNNLLRRNASQVNNADAVFAVGNLEKNNTTVKGGTGWAVQMAVDIGKPVHVFDETQNSWFTWDGSTFVKESVPTLTKNFAGIGTRDITSAGNKAIRDVYEATLYSKAPEIASEATIESKPAKTTPKAEVSSQATTEPRTVSKILAVPLTNDSVLAQEKVEALRALAKKAGKLPTELVERGKRAVRQLGRVASLKPDQLKRLDSYINNLRKDIVTYVKSKGKTDPSSSSISSPISVSAPEVAVPVEQSAKPKQQTTTKKKLSVNQVIRQKLTNDPKIARDKIVALETTAKVSGNLPEAITKRLEVIKTHLGRVTNLDEDRLIRLNKAVISLATDMRANVKTPLSRAKYLGIANTLIKNTNLLSNPKGRLDSDKVIGTPTGYNASNVFVVKDIEQKGLFNKVNNFFDGLYRSKKITKTITGIIGETTKDDRKILKSISEFHDEIKDTLKSKISFLDINEGIRPEYQKDGKQVLSALDQNPLGYLVSEVDGDRIIDENILGLMSTVMYDWLGTRASNTLINTDDDIRSILGKDEDVELTSEERKQFKYSGSVRNIVMENLGKTVVKQLGLEVGKGIDGNMLDRLAMSIGQVMIATGLEQGLLETSKVDGKTMGKYKGKNFQGDPRETTFIKLKGTANHRPTDKIIALQDTIKLNPKFINSMFGIESFQVFPTTKPSNKIPKYLKGTTQTLPEEIQKATLAKQQVKWEIKNNSFAVVNNISRESFQRLAGVIEDLESEHISDRESIDSKNQKIIRDIDNYFTTIDTVDKDSDIYFQYAPAKNLRSNIINNMLNVQSSKVARHLVGAKAWNVTIPDVNSKDADKIRNNFKAAVTQSFGFKIETKTPQQIEDRFEQLLANETVREGVEAVKEISKGNSTPKLEAALEAAVKLGGENLHSLDGILALVQYNPTESFTTNMGIEVDGVTNGIAIGLMQAPILLNMAHILKSVGIYLNGSNDANYPSWASNPLNRDLYKTLAGTWVNKLNEFKTDPKQLQQIELLESLIGKFITEEEFEGEVVEVVSKLGRDMSKDPLMTTGYGAGINKIVDNLNKKFFVQINKKLKEASKLEDKKAVQLATKEIVENVFKIVGLQVPKGIDYSKPLEIEFDFRTQKLLTEVITNTYGETLELALEESLGRFFEFRDTINRMTGAMFKVFEHKYNDKIKAETKAKGKVLTKEEEQVIFDSLREYLPIINSPFSKNLSDGLLPIDFNTVREYGNPKAAVQAKVGKTKGLGKTVKGADILSITGTVGHTAYAEPGARGLVLLTQAQDASIQAKSSYNHDSLDIFDAKVLSILDVDAATHETNQAFWDITTDYSVMDSTHAAFTRVVKLAAKEPVLRKVLLDSINGRRRDRITVNDFNQEVLALKAEITQARKVIKETPDISINQYAHGADSAYRVNFEEETNIEDNLSEMLDEWIDSIKDIDEQSGSSINPIDFDNFNSVYDQNLSADNSLRIFENMANFGNKVESPEHSAHLKEILTNVVNKVLRATDNIEFRVGETKGVSYGAAKGEKVYINASTANRLNNNNELSLQEIQVHELLHTTLNYGIDNNFHLRQELKKIFRVVDKGIRDIHGDQGWKIFMNPNGLVQVDQAQEEAAAKERYDYIFNNTKVDVVQVIDPLTGKLTEKSTNNYLKEFVSFGLTNEAFLKVLAQIDTRVVTPTKGLPLKEKLTIWLNRLLDWVSGKLLHTRNLSADVALRNLVDHLAATTSKQRNAAIVQHDRARNINEFASRKIYQWMVKPLRDYAFDRAGRPKNIIGKIKTTIGLIPETFNNSQLRKNIKEVLRRIKVTEENFAIKLVREIQGTKTSNIAWHTLLRQSKHLIDSARKSASVDIQKYLRNSFVVRLPSKEESYALTRVVLKGDMSVLMDKYNMDDLIGLLTNETTLSNAIKETQAELKVFGSNANYYMVQAAGLGRWIATGKKPNRLQALNAHNIANMYLDIRDDKSKVIGDVKVAEEIIDRLATLYSFQSMTKDNKALVADVMMRENKANNQDNGIISLLNVQRDFKKKALADLFKNNKIQTIKGYTHETFNPRTDIKIATIREEAELLRSGYVRSKDPLETDSKNPNQTQNYMYVLKDAAGVQYNKSIVSLTNKLARGTTLLDGHVSAGSLTPKAEAIRDVKKYIQKTKGDVHRQFTNPGSIPVTDEEILIPILDDRGNITELRHTMSEFHKITLLERDDRFEVVMGNMYGSIKDKVNSKQVNRKVVEMAYEDFQKGFTDEPNAFVKISPKSSEKRYKELFDLLPDDMRKDIQTVWGGKEITIRRELADLIFGYRQWSITHLFKDSTNPALARINRALQHHKVRHIEAIWQEVVKLAKTNIVIRTSTVLIDNFVSNVILSVVKGVPIRYMMKNQALALRALHNYQEDLHKRNALQLRLDSTPNLTDAQKKNLKVSINRLNDDLTNNPVSKLIDEGVFQAITEDLEDSKSPYDYKDKVLSDFKLDKLLSDATPLTRDAVQQAFMTEETTIFKLLMKGTQYSDFIARFALHKFNTEERLIIGKDGKERRGMSEDESLTDVLETFINYDIPTSKELQYMNDMGFFMFTKFLFRIQKVIFNLLKDRPVSTAASVLIQQVLGDVPDILDTIGFDFSGRAGFFIGPLDTATNISGVENVMNLVGY